MNSQNQDSKARILDESFELFRKHGIHYVTMDLIAGTLGISKKTVYANFPSKEDLLYHCLRNYIGQQRNVMKQLLEQAPNVMEGLVSLAWESTSRMSETNPLMYVELDKYYPKLSKELMDSRREEDYRELVSLIDRGKAQGLMLQGINTDIATRLFLAQVQHMNNYELFPISNYPRTELFTHIFITFLRGIATPKGQAVLNALLEQNNISTG